MVEIVEKGNIITDKFSKDGIVILKTCTSVTVTLTKTFFSQIRFIKYLKCTEESN